MADKRLNIILTVSDKGTVKVNKATKGIKNLEVQTVKSSRSMISSFVKVGAALAAAFSAKILIGFTNSAISTADKIAKTASKIGVATDALQELRFAAERTGVANTALDMGLQRFTRRVAEAVQGSGELKGTLDQYSIAVKNADGSSRKTTDVLADLADVIQNVDSDSERLRIAFKAFDSEGAALVNTFRNGAAGLAALRKEARDTGNVIDADLLPGFEAARDAIDTAGGAIRTTFINAVGEAAPEIKKLADEIRKLAADEGFKTFVTDTVRLAADLVTALATIPMAMADIGRALRGENVGQLDGIFAEIINEAEIQNVFTEAKNLGILGWTKSTEGLLQEIATNAPGLFARFGIDPATMLPVITGPPDALAATAPSDGGEAQPSGLGFRIELEKQRLAQIHALRFEAAAKSIEIEDAMVTSINAGEQEALDFSRAKAQERLDLVAELATQREEAQVEYVDSWRVAEQERTDAAIRASDIIAERELEQIQATKDAQADMLDTIRAKIEEVSGAIGQSVAQVVVFGKSASAVFKQLFQSIAAQVIAFLVKTTIQYLVETLVQLEAAAIAFAARSAQNVSLAATTAGASAAAGGPAAIAAAGAAAAGATTAAGTTAYAAALGLFGGLGQAHAGLTNVPREGTFLLDRGERVVAPEQNRDLTDFLAGAGGGGGGKRTEFVFLRDGVTAIGKLLRDDSIEGRNRLVVA